MFSRPVRAVLPQTISIFRSSAHQTISGSPGGTSQTISDSFVSMHSDLGVDLSQPWRYVEGMEAPADSDDSDSMARPVTRRFTDEAWSFRVSERYTRGKPRTRLPVDATFTDGRGIPTCVSLLAMDDKLECTVTRWPLPYSPESRSWNLRISWSETLNFGGRSVGVHCPGCDRRCSVLYHVLLHVLCADCAQLSYRSRHDPAAAKEIRTKRRSTSSTPI